MKLQHKPRLQSFDVSRDRPPTYHVQAWYDEVRYYSYPYSQECNPHCPFRCSGPVCTHYTQVSVTSVHATFQSFDWTRDM